jgi:hypothetical protein
MNIEFAEGIAKGNKAYYTCMPIQNLKNGKS